ncbi:MAG: NAD-dependent succinate-semialdehyde dehydrogenase [Pseudomonadota bacterium]
MYRDTQLLIAAQWIEGGAKETIPVQNPATGETIGSVAKATTTDLDRAVDASEAAFQAWRKTPALTRSSLLRIAANNVRSRADAISRLLTMEQGKPLNEARLEVEVCAETLEWAAEESRRIYDRGIPARRAGVVQRVIRQPLGPVAAFTPWNFPVSQAAKKVAPALAAGCSIIIKGSEETPASTAEMMDAIARAGFPSGLVQLLFGDPQEISSYLVPHRLIKKVSFTGSVPVGKRLASLAGQHMKPTTMELGGHAPAIVFADVDIDETAAILAASKFRNAGQVCVSPTRFLIQSGVYKTFLERFTEITAQLEVGDGLEQSSKMGPLINERRVAAVDDLVRDARNSGASVSTGGARLGNRGYFYAPTVVADADPAMRIMNEEPFGPVAVMCPFESLDEVITEANRLPFGLASYAFTRSAKNIECLSTEIEAGMLSINHLGLALPETPFGGMKESGYGSEGGTEGIESYLTTKFVTHDAYF